MIPRHTLAIQLKTSLSMYGFYIISMGLAKYVSANPVQPYNLEARDDNSDPLSPRAWVPIVVIFLLLSLVALTIWFKGSWKKAIVAFGDVYNTAHVTDGNPTVAGRELTAEQLVGSINGTGSPTSGPARQTRRTRRPRRTPSQMSVTSLPAYNKEPGEEELVIFRGRDMEDATTMPAAMVEMPADEDDSLNSQDNSQVSRYSPMPITSNNLPLLHNDDPSGDLSLQSLRSPNSNSRPSFDSSLQETSSLMRVDSNLPRESSDQRGEAPPYFEFADHTPESDSGAPTTQTPFMPSSTSSESQRRGSAFRTFLNRMSMMSHTPEHRRTESNQSVSTSNTHRRDRSTPIRTSNHRASPSASMFRTISRQRSNHTLNSAVRLNSPSTISLNSISSPLSHTLIRTEFSYPKSGPTPEQLKVISSRENFSRFGMPYGVDAIAFAASSSRQDLEPPPPVFEASSSQSSLARPGPSGLQSSDNAADTREGRPPIPEPTLEGGEAARDSTTPSSLPLDTQSENVANTSTPSITYTEPSSASPSTSKIPNPISPTDPSSSTSTSKIPNPLSPTDPSSSASSTFKDISPTDRSSSPTPSTYILPPLPPPINIFSEFGNLYTSTSLTPQDATTRSESRASNYSFQSYATAPESLGWGYINSDSGRSTPRLGDGHVVSDMTDEMLTATTGLNK
ncbi:hypothetical protein BYT27DRAFT_7341452 [Phlegmacium glaucopus]|nr:hypothetical protein BYT27DRAFT_7341452 [Phlegmacium glaucopus]